MKLNLGGGETIAEGWVNLDLRAGAQVLGEAQRLPFRDGAFDGAFANHSLCAMTWHQLPGVVAEVRRVLAPDARFRVSVPDVVGAFRAYERGDPAWFPIDGQCPTIGEKLAAYLTWFSTNRTCFTPESLIGLLARSFTAHSVVTHGLRWDWPDPIGLRDLDDRFGESLFVEAW